LEHFAALERRRELLVKLALCLLHYAPEQLPTLKLDLIEVLTPRKLDLRVPFEPRLHALRDAYLVRLDRFVDDANLFIRSSRPISGALAIVFFLRRFRGEMYRPKCQQA